jgi:type II secretion system protein C
MERFIAFFYRYRFKLALMFSILALDLVLSGIILNAVNYWLREPVPPFAPYSIEITDKIKMASLEDYLQKILNGTFFQKPSASGENPAITNVPTESVEFEKLGLVLVGTVTGPQWFSRAFIRANNSKEKKDKYGQAYKIGEKILDGRILWIFRDKVLIKYSGKKEYLYLHPQEKTEKKGTSAPVVSGGGETFSKVMTRGELNKQIFNNLNNIMKGLAVGPNFKGSKMDGYKLKRVQPTNVLYSLGARSGDIVKAVNGHKIDDITKLLKLWERMRTEKNIKVDLERQGKIVTYDFSIRD